MKSASFRAGRLLRGIGFCGGTERLDERERTTGVDEEGEPEALGGVEVFLSSEGMIEKRDSLQLDKSRRESWCIESLGGAAEKESVGRVLELGLGSSSESSSLNWS